VRQWRVATTVYDSDSGWIRNAVWPYGARGDQPSPVQRVTNCDQRHRVWGITVQGRSQVAWLPTHLRLDRAGVGRGLDLRGVTAVQSADVGTSLRDWQNAARRTAMHLSMDKAGTAAAARPLVPQVASTQTQGTGRNPTACWPGVHNHGEGSSEFPRPEPTFRDELPQHSRIHRPY
jgi:hypothetical protein